MIDQEWNSVYTVSHGTFPERHIGLLFYNCHIHISSIKRTIVILVTDLTYKAMTQLDEHRWGKIQILSKLAFWVLAECAFSKEIIDNAE